MTQEEQLPRQVGIQSNKGGNINIEQSQINIAGGPQYISITPLPHDARQKRLLDKVREYWIKGVLEPSLDNSKIIVLELHEEPHMVRENHPWDSVVAQQPQVPLGLSLEISISQVYDQAGGELLILGEPGSGKTVLLLQLACILLDRTTQGKESFIPVVFHLSSWAMEQLSIADWLRKELHDRYGVPKKFARSWVDSDQILPLLDGLDEVAPDLREECAEKINSYHKEHGLVPIIVSSRKADYQALKTKLLLNRAVSIKPPTEKQAQDYLSNANGLQEALRAYLLKDNMFKELLTTPLMLRVITQAFQGRPLKDLIDLEKNEFQQSNQPQRVLRAIRHAVFETYVQSMFERRERAIRHRSQKVMRQLSWLAQQMSQRHLTQFSSDLIYLDWVPTQSGYQSFCGLVIRFLAFCIGFGFGACFFLQLGSGDWIRWLPTCLLGLFSAFVSIAPREPAVIVSNFSLLLMMSCVICAIAFIPLIIFILVVFFVHIFSQGLSPLHDLWLWIASGFQAVRGFAVYSAGMASVYILFSLLLGVNGSKRAALNPKISRQYVGYIEHKVSLLFLRSLRLVSPRFFNHAVSCMLLQKVGRGYIFIHPLLLDYFASLNINFD